MGSVQRVPLDWIFVGQLTKAFIDLLPTILDQQMRNIFRVVVELQAVGPLDDLFQIPAKDM